ncbi:hypothetical protein HK100_006382 [Physocladia obscura]|uniref:Nudix hydrolase domain-containing protein n=1 Tax=Physocladia obscura TaxID=109957 RepID=A0AAD5SQK5_9FUNG|nr:hypothetical protein HK100_006382 [Physocladia obscura]
MTSHSLVIRRLSEALQRANSKASIRWKYSSNSPREAAVLALLADARTDTTATKEMRIEDLGVVLTVRAAGLRRHAGEVSLCGGAVDATDENAVAAAIRETHEEIGVDPRRLAILGPLPSVPDHTFETRVAPFLALVVGGAQNASSSTSATPPNASPAIARFDKLSLVLSPNEVESCFVMKIADLLDSGNQAFEQFRGNAQLRIPTWYGPNNERIWGLTAYIIDNMLKTVIQPAINEQKNNS